MLDKVSKAIDRTFDVFQIIVSGVIGAIIGLVAGVFLAVKTGGMEMPPSTPDALIIGGAVIVFMALAIYIRGWIMGFLSAFH